VVTCLKDSAAKKIWNLFLIGPFPDDKKKELSVRFIQEDQTKKC